jgi:hypothetical protein
MKRRKPTIQQHIEIYERLQEMKNAIDGIDAAMGVEFPVWFVDTMIRWDQKIAGLAMKFEDQACRDGFDGMAIYSPRRPERDATVQRADTEDAF